MTNRTALLLGLLVLVACTTTRSKTCTLIGAVPSIQIDASRIAAGLDPEDVLVCLEEDCQTLAQVDPGGWVRFLDEGQGTHRDIEVRARDGSTLAGPTTIRFDERYPNGKECDPRVLAGRIVIDDSGVIEKTD